MSTTTAPRRHQLRQGLGILGGLIFLVGFLTVISPEAAAATEATLQALVVLLGNDYFVVAILGILALVLVLAVLVGRVQTGVDQTTPPPPEKVHPVPHFGEPIDAFISAAGVRDLLDTDRHEDIQDRLHRIAVTTVMREANCTKAEAHDLIESGTWTDNETAASFLTAAETPDLVTRLRAALGGRSPYKQAARETAAEIARLDEEATR